MAGVGILAERIRKPLFDVGSFGLRARTMPLSGGPGHGAGVAHSGAPPLLRNFQAEIGSNANPRTPISPPKTATSKRPTPNRLHRT